MTQADAELIRVSVVIPAHRPDGLAEQLDAVLDQQLSEPFEVVAVVRPGTPAAAIVEAGCARATNLRHVTFDTARGPSAARNTGAAAARGSILAFCDADDLVAPGWLAALVAGLADVDAVGGPADLLRLNSAEVLEAYGDDGGVSSGHNLVGGWRPWAETHNLAVDRAWFERLGGFDAGLRTAEDRDFSLRLQEQGGSLGWAQGAGVHRRLRTTTRAQVRQAFEWARGEPKLYARHRAAGMPAADPGWRAWARLGRRLPQLLDRHGRVCWLRDAACRVGRLVGSVEARAWYP